MSAPGVILILALAAIPPLSDDQRVRLGDTADGRGYQEAAFDALVENVRLWSPGAGDAPVRLHPNLEAMLADPDSFRGQVCRITGAIQQQTQLPAPHDDVVEWFVRDDDDRPILIYVLGPQESFRDGQEIAVLARFYKYVDEKARDGEVHRYPAFVGAFPTRLATGEVTAWWPVWIVAVPVALMLIVFLVLFVYATRRRPSGSRRRLVSTGTALPEEGIKPLPEDPAEALAELRRRATKPEEDTGSVDEDS